MTTEQKKLLVELDGLKEQITKGHFLNAHFRAFQLANNSWQEHMRQNALIGSRKVQSAGGAVLDDTRDERRYNT